MVAVPSFVLLASFLMGLRRLAVRTRDLLWCVVPTQNNNAGSVNMDATFLMGTIPGSYMQCEGSLNANSTLSASCFENQVEACSLLLSRDRPNTSSAPLSQRD
jgi:hypothetical protein